MLHLSRRLLAAAVAVAAGAAVLPLSGLAAQQNATVTGRVTSNGEPLGGAQVGIVEIGVGSVTDAQGRYTFTVDVARASGKPVTVLARTIGYRPKKHVLTLVAGRNQQDFDLEKDILNLEAQFKAAK